MSNNFSLKESEILADYIQENGLNIVPICEKITITTLIDKYENQLDLCQQDILNVKCPDEIKIRKQVEQMLLREFIKDLKKL
jgi:hypothetical protein